MRVRIQGIFLFLFVVSCKGDTQTRDFPTPQSVDDTPTAVESSPTPVYEPTVTPLTPTPTSTPTPTPSPTLTPTPTPTPTPIPFQTPEEPEEWRWSECPPHWFLIDAMTIDVGAPPEVYEQLNEQGYMVSRVPLYETTVEAFCISPFPYPGFSGSQWNPGLNLAQAGELDVELWEYNLRLATGSEYLVAVATSENHRWPQNVGSWQEAHCDDDPYNPEPMGSHPDCMSVWGPGALLTYAFWVRTDETLEKTLLNTTTGAWQTVKDYIVMGGMPTSWNAYYGDDHWGAHGHGDEEAYMDDKAGFLVSQPWGITPEYWEAFEKTVSQSTQRYSTVQKRKIHERPSWMRAQR